MNNYIIGLVFLICYVYFLCALGKVINPYEKKSLGIHFILGYVCFTSLHALGGIIVQIFQMPWIIFYWYSVFIIGLCLLFIFLKSKDHFKSYVSFKEFFKQYWFLILILLMLLSMSILNISGNWLCNHLDDGWYLNFISLFPRMDKPYTTNLASGLPESIRFIRMLSTFEIEDSFFVALCHIEPTVFARFVMTTFHYLLTLVVIYEFVDEVCKHYFPKLQRKYFIQFFTVIIVVYGFYRPIINGFKDMWQFSTAMWYGSSVVRVTGLFLCLVPLLLEKRLTKHGFAYAILVSFTLMTRASQALPILCMLVVAYFGYDFYRYRRSYSKWVIGITLLLLFCIPYINNSNYPQIDTLTCYVDKLTRQPLLWIMLVIFLSGFLFRNEYINRWNCIILTILGLMFIPRINHLFLNTANYDFVVGRTILLLWITLSVMSFTYFCIWCIRLCRNNIRVMSIIGICMLLLFGITFKQHYSKNTGFKKSISILKENPLLFPTETIQLCNYLDQEAIQQNKKLNILTPTLVSDNGYAHPLSVMLRIKSNRFISVSALPRYWNYDSSSIFMTYNENRQHLYNQFNANPRLFTFNLVYLLQKYPIDYCIFSNLDAALVAQEYGYDFLEEESKNYKNMYIVRINN